MGRKRRKRQAETNLVPLSVYQDEAACRLWIAWLERQLRQAHKVLVKLMSQS